MHRFLLIPLMILSFPQESRAATTITDLTADFASPRRSIDDMHGCVSPGNPWQVKIQLPDWSSSEPGSFISAWGLNLYVREEGQGPRGLTQFNMFGPDYAAVWLPGSSITNGGVQRAFSNDYNNSNSNTPIEEYGDVPWIHPVGSEATFTLQESAGDLLLDLVIADSSGQIFYDSEAEGLTVVKTGGAGQRCFDGIFQLNYEWKPIPEPNSALLALLATTFLMGARRR